MRHSQNCSHKRYRDKRYKNDEMKWQNQCAVTSLCGLTKGLGTQRGRIAEYWRESSGRGRERIKCSERREREGGRVKESTAEEVWPSVWSGLYACCEQLAQSVGRWAEEDGSLHPKCPGFPPAWLPRGLETAIIRVSATVLCFMFKFNSTMCGGAPVMRSNILMPQMSHVSWQSLKYLFLTCL